MRGLIILAGNLPGLKHNGSQPIRNFTDEALLHVITWVRSGTDNFNSSSCWRRCLLADSRSSNFFFRSSTTVASSALLSKSETCWINRFLSSSRFLALAAKCSTWSRFYNPFSSSPSTLGKNKASASTWQLFTAWNSVENLTKCGKGWVWPDCFWKTLLTVLHHITDPLTLSWHDFYTHRQVNIFS